jgi:type I restriction enzyme S subunit
MKEGWEYKKLGEVATYINGYAFKPSEWGDCGLPIIRIQNLNDENASFNYYSGDIDNKYIVKYGDILISWSASIGVYEWKGDDALLNQHIFKVVFDKSNIDKYYLKFCVCSRINEMLKNVHGATMKHIVKGDFDNTTIPVPPLPIQQQIVSHLDKINEIIDKQRELLKVFDKLEQSIFYNMFGDPVSNEKRWGITKLQNLCEISSSKRIYANEYVSEGIPFYRSKEVIEKSNDKSISVELYISNDKYEQIKRKYGIPKKGDMLLTAVGTIGEIWIVDTEEPFYYKDGNLLLIRIKNNVNSIYFKYLLKNLISAYKNKMANGCAYKALTIINLKEMNTNIIPLSLQQSFAARITSIETQKQKIQSSIDKFQEMLDGAMNEYFDDN